MEVEALEDLGPTRRRAFFDRGTGIEAVQEQVTEIVETVKTEGDVAVRRYTEEFDDVSVGNLEVTSTAERAYERLDDDVCTAIETAASNIQQFHERQTRADWQIDTEYGMAGRRFRPLERVGAYVPGGGAAYPSSALMTVIPAQVAGVEQIAVATPPGDPIHPATLAALHVAGADEIYRVGGAQGIAALAHGTESIPPVQKIVGPGNRWVTAAKAAVRGTVEIDFLAGPSEILVIADETATPAYVAADMIAQAEHGPRSPCVAVVTDDEVGRAIVSEVNEQIESASRRETVETALDHAASGVIVVRSMSEAIGFTEEYAPEHLSVQADGDEAIADRIDSAGSVFLGPMTPVAAGDYASGTNHVLPTHGLAKRTGGLSVDEFVRSTTVQRLSVDGLASLAPTITTLARAEGLDAHADSVTIRRADSDARWRQD